MLKNYKLMITVKKDLFKNKEERFMLRLSNPIIVKTNINGTNKQINDWLKTSLFRTKQLVIAKQNINAKRHELIIIN